MSTEIDAFIFAACVVLIILTVTFHQHEMQHKIKIITHLKATISNSDCGLQLQKTKLKDEGEYVAQKSNLSENRSYFTQKMSFSFPSDIPRLLCLTAAFYLAELSPTTTCCCSCSFRLQAASILLRNLRESQSWGRAVVGHQRKNQRTFSP